MNTLLCTLALTLLASPIGTVGVGGGADGAKPAGAGSAGPAPITVLAVDAQGKLALTGSAKGEVRRYVLADVLTFAPVGTLRGSVSALAWGQDGSAFAADDRGHLFEIPKDGPPRLLARHPAGVRALAAGAGFLLSGGDDGVIRMWSTQDGEPLGALTGHTGPVTGLALTQGTELWSVGWDRTLRGWKIKTPGGKTRPRVAGRQKSSRVAGPREVCGLAISPQGDRVLTTCWDGALRLWQTGKKKQRPEVFAKRPFQEWTSAVAFDAKGERAVALAPAESRLLVVDLAGETPRTRSLAQAQAPSTVGLAQGKALVGRFDGTLGWVSLDPEGAK